MSGARACMLAVTIAALEACGSTAPSGRSTTLIDLAAARALLENDLEPGHVDVGGEGEAGLRLTGFSEPRVELGVGRFRAIEAGGRGQLELWLFRPGVWSLRLRYRGAACELSMAGARLGQLAAMEQWTERTILLDGELQSPALVRIEASPEPGAAWLLDWIEARPVRQPLAQARAAAFEDGALIHSLGSQLTGFAEIPERARDPRLEYGIRNRGGDARVQILVEGEGWERPIERSFDLKAGERLEGQTLEVQGGGACRIRLRAWSNEGAPDGLVEWLAPRLVTADAPEPQATVGPGAGSPFPPPRDVFVFVLDTGRADHFGFHGQPRQTTPWIDGLARDGVVLANAWAQAPYTQASTATLMTGLEPETHGVRGVQSRLSERATTLAELLSGAGYRTTAFIGCANADHPFGFAQGFHEFLGFQRQKTLARLDKTLDEPGKNFFYVHLFPPHHPYLPPPPFAGLYSGRIGGTVLGTSEGMISLRRSGRGLPEKERQFLIAQYDENLLYGDRLVADILNLVAGKGRLDEALILVISDHGEAFFEHGTIMHGYTLYEEEIRISMLIRPPKAWGLRPGVRLEPAATRDILPTLAELAHAKDTTPRPGRSLLPVLLGKAGGEPEIYARAQGNQRTAMLVAGRYKVHCLDTETKLFDLWEDPGELRDLAGQRPILAGWLRQKAIERMLRNLADGQAANLREQSTLDQKTIDELRSLGYIE